MPENMDSYLLLLFVNMEQEKAIKDLFNVRSWAYKKPDLSTTTKVLGPTFDGKPALMNYPIGKSGTTEALGPNFSGTPAGKDNDPTGRIVVSGQDDNLCRDVKKGNKVNNPEVPTDHDYMVKQQTVTDDSQAHPNEPNTKTPVGDQKGPDPILSQSQKRRIRKRKKKKKKYEDIEVGLAESNEGTTATTGSERKENENCGGFGGKDPKAVEISESSPAKRMKLDSDGSTPCSVCGKCISARNIPRHMRSHENFPYKCGACSLYFNTQEEKEGHDKERHDGLRYICSVCGVRYKFLNSLKEHIGLKHENLKLPFACPVCDKGFSRVGQREDHVNTHSESSPYACTTCKRTYNNKSSFKRHTQSCTADMSFTCTKCGFKVKSVVQLQIHVSQVHKNHIFACKCGAVFDNESISEKHALNCFGPSTNSAKPTDKPIKVDVGEKVGYGVVSDKAIENVGITVELGDGTGECDKKATENVGITVEVGDGTVENENKAVENVGITVEVGDGTVESENKAIENADILGQLGDDNGIDGDKAVKDVDMLGELRDDTMDSGKVIHVQVLTDDGQCLDYTV